MIWVSFEFRAKLFGDGRPHDAGVDFLHLLAALSKQICTTFARTKARIALSFGGSAFRQLDMSATQGETRSQK